MRLQLEREILVDILQKAYGISAKKSSIPVLSHVHIDATSDNVVIFSATDLDLSLRIQTPADIEERGQATVSVKKFLDIIREIPQPVVTIELTNNNRVLITAGRSLFQVATISADEFPYFNFPHDIVYISCNPELLRKAIMRTVYAVPLEDDPFSVPGLFWQVVEDQQLRFVASDGHRLVYEQIDLPQLSELGIENGVTMPRKGVQELARILENETEVSFGSHESRLIFRTQNSQLSIQLLEEEFPNYEVIIPDERPHHFMADREQLYQALKRTAVLTDQKWKHVRFNIHDNTLELFAGNPDLGQASDALDIEQEGDDFSVAFNVRYVLDTVQAIESEKIRFEWVDKYHGGIFLEPGNADYFALIMPMMI